MLQWEKFRLGHKATSTAGDGYDYVIHRTVKAHGGFVVADGPASVKGTMGTLKYLKGVCEKFEEQFAPTEAKPKKVKAANRTPQPTNTFPQETSTRQEMLLGHYNDPADRLAEFSKDEAKDLTTHEDAVVVDQKSSLLAKALRQAVAPRNDNGTPPHVIVVARAGSGKTTTLVEGMKVMRGMGSTFIPSEQQRAIWDEMAKSKDARTICFVAFNKDIATELQRRVPSGVDAMTMHSMGFKAINKAFRLQYGKSVNANRTDLILEELTGKDINDLRRDEGSLLNAVKSLVEKCKVNLAEPDHVGLDEMVDYYEVDMEGVARSRCYDLVAGVMERAKDVAKDGCIDYNDMIWIPVVLDLPLFRYDLLLVDEAQDLNRCQQALVKRAGRRLILCGDPKQAIYGFAGADCESMNRMGKELDDMGGCVELPLTFTRRCGRAIVAEANKTVPDFGAFETNPAGCVSHALYTTDTNGTEIPYDKSYMSLTEDGDMVLCRVNAPLVSQCFKFLRMGRKATIRGRDIGKSLTSTIKKMRAASVVDLVAKMEKWLEKETAKEQVKKFPNENKLIALQDRYDCIVCFTEGQDTVDGVLAKIDQIFTDNKDQPGVKLSSIHKAKGLEAKSVFLLLPKGAGCPHPMAKTPWQREQEMNLLYVAITRAIHNFTYVR